LLDEVGDLPAATQIKLLRVLQEGQFERVGGTEIINSDVRVLAATNRNLEKLISENLFREDLFYRLNVVTISIPPLRERREDILPLIDFFIQKYIKETQKQKVEISKEALNILLKYDYPGNIRELENIIHHSIVLSRNEIISTSDLPLSITNTPLVTSKIQSDDDLSVSRNLDSLEISLITKALEKTGGNQSKAAKLLDMSEKNLRYKLKKFGIVNKR
jgi:two-component system, NtrC family, response regulator AtoC